MENRSVKRAFAPTLVGLGLALFTTTLWAQQPDNDKPYLGKVKGAVESNMGFYHAEEGQPDLSRFGTNTFLNVGYEYKSLSAGLQYEIFEPPMRGFDADLKGNALTQYFVQYSGKKLQVRLGSFYEQYGSGLAFRAYEERTLGVNNSLRGINVKYTPTEWLSLKAMAGQPRRYITYADALMWGGDASLSLLKLINKESQSDLSLGASWVSRYNTKEVTEANGFPIPLEEQDPRLVNLYSLRSDFTSGDFGIGLEYTKKGASQSYFPGTGGYLIQDGDALLLTVDYTPGDFGISGQFRRVERMDFREDNKRKESYVVMNYIPALTKQHKYALPALYPHATNIGGEIGGEIDLYYNWHADWLGRYPLKATLNLAHYSSLGLNAIDKAPFLGNGGAPLYTEGSLELSKKFSRKVEATVGAYYQIDAHTGTAMKSFSQVADVLWRISRKVSLRGELQHMTTEQADKKWIYGLFELGFAPYLSVYGSDMYSYGADTPENYYTIGTAFSYHGLRLSANYGRSRAGIQCVGGICRFVPEYQGFTTTLTYAF